MRKLYRPLTESQKQRKVIFSSTLSTRGIEQPGDKTHEVFATDEDRDKQIERLMDDSYFNASHWRRNIIRK